MKICDISQWTCTPLNYKEKQCGVYCIRNKINGKVYIGSSVNSYHRVKSQHFDRLQRGTHTNPHLQSSWVKYGKNAFESFLIESCREEDLLKLEQKYIDSTGCLNPEVGYNINTKAEKTILTTEQRQKISISKKGKPRSKECKKKISIALKNKKWSQEALDNRCKGRIAKGFVTSDGKSTPEFMRRRMQGMIEKGLVNCSLKSTEISDNLR